MRPKYRAQRHAHRARVEKRSAPGSFGNSRRLTGRGSKRTVFGIGWCALRGVLVGGHATEIQSPATCPLSPRRKTVRTRIVRKKSLGLTGRGSKRTVFGIGTGIADAAAAESNACAPAAGQQRALDVLTQYKSVSRLAERGRPEDGKEGEGMLSVIGAEHGAAPEAEFRAGKVANGGRERAKSSVRWRFQADLYTSPLKEDQRRSPVEFWSKHIFRTRG